MSARVEILPGRGSVIRHGELTIWAGPGVSAELISFLQQSARNVATSATSGRHVADHIAAILMSRDPERSAPFAVIGPDGAGWALLLHGPVQAWDGNQWLAPSPDPGWLRTVVDPQPAVSVGPAGSPAPRLVLASPYNLVAGMVPGGGVIVLPGAGDPDPTPAPGTARPTAPPEVTPEPPGEAAIDVTSTLLVEPSAPEPTPEPEPLTAGPIVDLRRAPAPERSPLPAGAAPVPAGRPELGGIRCPRGHFNKAGAPTCAVCKTEIPAGSAQVPGLRPTLGVLLGDDGAVFRVDSDLLIGADPSVDDGVGAGSLRPVRLADPAGQLAPAHAEIRLQGWTVRVVDRGSAAGTFVWAAGTGEWARLEPYSPVDLPPGSHVSVAQRVLTFLSPWS